MDTIFALASARGRAGVSVVRLSGPDAHSVGNILCQGGLPEPRRAGLRRLVWEGDFLDEALVIGFEAGKSFTGEASVEFQVHGSLAVVARILAVLGGMPGMRLAEPGEFTRRALENGQLDLIQVEALSDLIAAETEAQRRQAVNLLSGALGQKVALWREMVLHAAALVEATIDFADEEVPVDVTPEVLALVDALSDELAQELRGAGAAERIREGFEVAIVGQPNAGKSTLLNALAGREAAITSEVAGTTRDVIEVRMEIAGLAVTVLDTAGLREAEDEVEAIGVARAISRAEAADLRVFLRLDDDEVLPLSPREGDIVVMGKADLRGGEGVSGRTGQGVDVLVTQISDILSQRIAGAGLLVRERQRAAVRGALASLARARDLLVESRPLPEFVAAELRVAMQSLEILVGRIGVEDMLGEIFGRFCIGK